MRNGTKSEAGTRNADAVYCEDCGRPMRGQKDLDAAVVGADNVIRCANCHRLDQIPAPPADDDAISAEDFRRLSSPRVLAEHPDREKRSTRIKTLLIVTAPGKTSTLSDVLFEASIEDLFNQFMGGLKPQDILAYFPGSDEGMEEARRFARKALAARQAFDEAMADLNRR